MKRAPDRFVIASRGRAGGDPAWRAAKGAWIGMAAARRAYDNGTLELAQGARGDAMVLYAMPRRVRAVRAPWFAAGGGGSGVEGSIAAPKNARRIAGKEDAP